MRYNEKTQDIMEHESRSVSNKMNNYNLDKIKVDTPSIFPYDPYIKNNHSGLFKNSDGKFMDINSEILNITRP